ncbi:MAG: YceI family protein, partial [Parvibaculaceae bacterium]|nr:YceI family protein [Parvibaculaceae bacterium]
MKRSIKRLSLLAATTLVALPLGLTTVQADSYKIDETHAHAAFSVTHLGFSTTYGQFKDIKGTFEFDETAPEKSTVDVTIQTSSVDTA